MLRLSRLAPLALALAFAACQDRSPTSPGTTNNTTTTTPIGAGKGFTLLLTDAPGDVVSAVVTISEVKLQGQGGEVSLLQHPFTGDLVQLRNSVATLVQGLDIPAGSYSQLRLIISGAYIEVATTNGTRVYASSPNYAGLPAGKHVDGDLQMPSFGTSGLKIDLPGGKLDVGQGATIVMIDFDASQSFGHQAGNSGKWIMHPVIKATNVTFGGNALIRLQLAQGVTLPQLNGQNLTLGAFTGTLTPVGGGTPIPVTFTDANNDGIFEAMARGLVPGQYTLTLTGPAGLTTTFTPTLPVTITVGSAQTTTQTITLSSAAVPGTVTATLKLGTGVTLPSVGTPPAAVTLAQFKAELTPQGGTATQVAFTDANNDGVFEASFANLAPGTYSLNIVKPAGTTITYDVVPPVTVTVTNSGGTQTKAFVVTAATAP